MADINHPVNLDQFADTIIWITLMMKVAIGFGIFWCLKSSCKKEHYSIIQNDVCCYCKINLRHSGLENQLNTWCQNQIDLNGCLYQKFGIIMLSMQHKEKCWQHTFSATSITSVDYPSVHTGFQFIIHILIIGMSIYKYSMNISYYQLQIKGEKHLQYASYSVLTSPDKAKIEKLGRRTISEPE